jgi:lipopolysaccharide export system permease protein
MTILFRYMLREYVKIFGMCFSGLMTIYLVIDFFEKVRRFLRYDARVLDVLTYFVLKMPAISYQIAPLAVLMATLLTIGLLSRSHEITAMRSCGISLYWITSPFLFFGTVLAMILFLFSSTVIPLALARAEQIKTTQIEKRTAPVPVKATQPWLSLGGQTLMNIDSIEPGGAVLRNVRLYRLSPTFELQQIAEAQRAVYSPQGWVLEGGIRRTFRPDGVVSVSTFRSEPLPLAHIPDDFTTWLELDSETMTLSEIRAYVDRLQINGTLMPRLLTDYYGRIAFPCVTFIMVVVGIALSLRRTGVRGSGMAMGIGQAMAVGFFYWSTHSVAIALGRGGALSPMVAGWMANMVFLTFGCYLLLKVRY